MKLVCAAALVAAALACPDDWINPCIIADKSTALGPQNERWCGTSGDGYIGQVGGNGQGNHNYVNDFGKALGLFDTSLNIQSYNGAAASNGGQSAWNYNGNKYNTLYSSATHVYLQECSNICVNHPECTSFAFESSEHAHGDEARWDDHARGDVGQTGSSKTNQVLRGKCYLYKHCNVGDLQTLNNRKQWWLGTADQGAHDGTHAACKAKAQSLCKNSDSCVKKCDAGQELKAAQQEADTIDFTEHIGGCCSGRNELGTTVVGASGSDNRAQRIAKCKATCHAMEGCVSFEAHPGGPNQPASNAPGCWFSSSCRSNEYPAGNCGHDLYINNKAQRRLAEAISNQPSGHGPDQVLINEPTNGVSGTGWSNTKVGKGYRHHTNTNMHGPWGNDVRSVERTFQIDGNTCDAQCTVSWVQYGEHTRDNEWDRVYVNDVEVGSIQMYHTTRTQKAGTWTGACSNALKLRFTSDLDQHYHDEAWGFGGVKIVRQACKVEQTCEACDEGFFKLGKNDNACEPCRNCTAGQYETADGQCTATQNRVCATHSDACGQDQYEDQSAISGNDGRDRVCNDCRVCPAGTEVDVGCRRPDPWSDQYWNSNDDGRASGAFSVTQVGDITGKVVVVHSPTGAKIACGKLNFDEKANLHYASLSPLNTIDFTEHIGGCCSGRNELGTTVVGASGSDNRAQRIAKCKATCHAMEGCVSFEAYPGGPNQPASNAPGCWFSSSCRSNERPNGDCGHDLYINNKAKRRLAEAGANTEAKMGAFSFTQVGSVVKGSYKLHNVSASAKGMFHLHEGTTCASPGGHYMNSEANDHTHRRRLGHPSQVASSACQKYGNWPFYCDEQEATNASPSNKAHQMLGFWMPDGAQGMVMDGSYSGKAPQCSDACGDGNTVCRPCVAGETFAPTSGSAKCVPVKTCGAGTYMTKEGTATTDRECATFTPCAVGHYIGQAGTATADQQCTPCTNKPATAKYTGASQTNQTNCAYECLSHWSGDRCSVGRTQESFEHETSPHKNKGLDLVDINNASATDLAKVYGIDATLAKRIRNKIRFYGPFASVHDLVSVTGISKTTAEEAVLNADSQAGYALPIVTKASYIAAKNVPRARKLCNLSTKDQCDAHSRCGHGRCVASDSSAKCGFTCQCDAGWTGNECRDHANRCIHGTQDGVGCKCDEGWKGDYCDEEVTVTDCTGKEGPTTITVTKKDGTVVSIDTTCFKFVGMDGKIHYADGKAVSGITTYRHTAKNSCPDGTNIWVPRSKDHFKQVNTKFSTATSSTWRGTYTELVGIWGNANGCGCCTSHAMNSNTCQDNHWSGVTNEFADGTTPSSPWFLMDNRYSEPNGDYTKDCWLHVEWLNSDGSMHRFNDGWCSYGFSKYICSTNRYTEL
eukprot:g5379.t1